MILFSFLLVALFTFAQTYHFSKSVFTKLQTSSHAFPVKDCPVLEEEYWDSEIPSHCIAPPLDQREKWQLAPVICLLIQKIPDLDGIGIKTPNGVFTCP